MKILMIDASSPAADNDSYHSFDLRFQAHFFSSMSVFWCLNQVSVKKKKNALADICLGNGLTEGSVMYFCWLLSL